MTKKGDTVGHAGACDGRYVGPNLPGSVLMLVAIGMYSCLIWIWCHPLKARQSTIRNIGHWFLNFIFTSTPCASTLHLHPFLLTIFKGKNLSLMWVREREREHMESQSWRVLHSGNAMCTNHCSATYISSIASISLFPFWTIHILLSLHFSNPMTQWAPPQPPPLLLPLLPSLVLETGNNLNAHLYLLCSWFTYYISATHSSLCMLKGR